MFFFNLNVPGSENVRVKCFKEDALRGGNKKETATRQWAKLIDTILLAIFQIEVKI